MNGYTTEELSGQSAPNGEVKVVFQENIAILHMLHNDNRLNVNFINNIHRALDEVEKNTDVEVLITTSQGKIYSNGLDLDWLSTIMDKQEKVKYFTAECVKGLFQRLITFPVPTIAAINGHAFAGGFMMALCHDYIIMSSTRGWVCLNEVHLGMLFTPYMRKLIQAKLPSGPATHEAMVIGKRYTATEALHRGIVAKICSIDGLEETAINFGKTIVKGGPYSRESLNNMKKDIYEWCFEIDAELPNKSKL